MVSETQPHFVQVLFSLDSFGSPQLTALDSEGYVWIQSWVKSEDKSVWFKQPLHWRIP